MPRDCRLVFSTHWVVHVSMLGKALELAVKLCVPCNALPTSSCAAQCGFEVGTSWLAWRKGQGVQAELVGVCVAPCLLYVHLGCN